MAKEYLNFVVESDTILKDYLKSKLSRKFFRNLKATSALILVNNMPKKNYEYVYVGDKIFIEYERKKEVNWDFVDIPLKVVYEDEHYLVVDKQEGILSIPTKGEPISVYQQIITYLNDKEASISLLNRLDKETSGLMLIAKDRYSANLLSPVKENITRRYYAIVEKSNLGSGLIDKPIDKSVDSNRRIISETGKKAITKYYTLYEKDNYSLLALELYTGRTHQIRVHLASLNAPILGDVMYGGNEASRMYLDSFYLSYIDPYTKEKREFIKEDSLSVQKKFNED